MLGFATWGVLAFHLTHRHVLSAGWVPVLYAVAMATAAIAALGSGRMYDRRGLRGLVVLPVLAAVVPLLSFATAVPAVVVGAGVWGAGMGLHDSTMRAAVTDLVPRSRRGAGYGTFTAVYGLAWLAGAAIIGVLYDHGTTAVEVFVVGGAAGRTRPAAAPAATCRFGSRRPRAPSWRETRAPDPARRCDRPGAAGSGAGRHVAVAVRPA